ncbi:hypothetical protein PUV54_13985 [Hyphococcus flavus]|uniref:Uncharacterized protein n=1 Tax=Hyphococcus flavus TaxID=1866326 RepID=A0AAF0CEC2_9PROT|nr:hypothetical protein [Hyphococcus flavus]WDI31061.1 hypothetical protein PUV54_13985 [Hyphococcus flavus]
MPERENLKRTEKLQLMLDEKELQAIDDWRFENRMPTRAAAIRELLRRGLIATPHFEEPDAEATTRDFGVVDETVEAALKSSADKS